MFFKVRRIYYKIDLKVVVFCEYSTIVTMNCNEGNMIDKVYNLSKLGACLRYMR